MVPQEGEGAVAAAREGLPGGCGGVGWGVAGGWLGALPLELCCSSSSKMDGTHLAEKASHLVKSMDWPGRYSFSYRSRDLASERQPRRLVFQREKRNEGD